MLRLLPPHSADLLELPTLALSLHQPFLRMLETGQKPLEFRPWHPPAKVVGTRIALHASRLYDQERLPPAPGDVCYPEPAECVQSAITSTALVAGYFFLSPLGFPVRSGVSEAAAHELMGSWWFPHFADQVAWVLRDIVVLPAPVACRGRQRLWALPAELRLRLAIVMGRPLLP